MQRIFYLALALLGTFSLQAKNVLHSPDGSLEASFFLNENGTPKYTLSRNGVAVITPSSLGFCLRGTMSSDGIAFGEDAIVKYDARPEMMLTEGFVILSTAESSFDETWTPVWGEEDKIRNHYNELLVCLDNPAEGFRMNIRFRLFDDGLGFRYEFPHQKLSKFVIKEELTYFCCAEDNETWWIPGDYDTEEYEYGHCKISEIPARFESHVRANSCFTLFSKRGIQTSVQMKTKEGLFVNIHEAALVDYPCMQLLLNEKNHSFRSWLTPDGAGYKGNINTPFKTPWRTIQVAENACAQLQSRLVLNLNDPCVLDDVSWIHPVKYVGVWWEMISGCGDWALTKKHSANNENVRRYIDFAAKHGFDAVLVEGWNEGWEDWFHCNKDEVFDFVTPYPDFDIKALNEYAHSKGVKLIMHHETSSSVRNYERHMEEAYTLMNKYGYDAVKSGYVGDILPLGINHYCQWMVNHYLYAVKEAAKHHVMVNAHEAVRPSGLCRTYPNLICNESAMGTEYQSFGGIMPGHTAVLPFTRLNGGPMDYTPGIFEMDLKKQGGNDSRVLSTICGQLGIYMAMYSPLQMAADFPQNYERFPDAFQFIKDVAVDWSESRYLFAEPQDYVVVARKAKGSGQWFCGGVTDEQERRFQIPLDFLGDGKYVAKIYADAPDADYRNNPQAYRIFEKKVTAKSKLDITMKPGGGFAVSFERMD